MNEVRVIGRPKGTFKWIWLEERRNLKNELVGYAVDTGRYEGSFRKYNFYRIDQVELRKFKDKEELRQELATSFANSILQNPEWCKHFNGHSKNAQFDFDYYKKLVVDNAISYADYMIEQLSKPEEE